MSEEQNPLDALRDKFEELQNNLPMPDVTSALNEATEQLRELPAEVARLRSRAYNFAKSLENNTQNLQQQWESARNRVMQAVQSETFNLRDDFQRLGNSIRGAGSKLGGMGGGSASTSDLENQLERIESAFEAAQTRVKEIYENLVGEISEVSGKVSSLHWMLDQRDEASFQFNSGENLFILATAEWVNNDGNPDGIFYVTDQRLIFEQKETTGKFLGLFGGKKQHSILWEVPIGQVESVSGENKGFFGGKDMLNLKFKSGAPMAETVVEVKGGVASKEWAEQITKVLQGKLSEEKV